MLPELRQIEQVIRDGGAHLETRVVGEVACGSERFPIPAIVLGDASPSAPGVGFFGGIHGIERIGAQVVIAFLQHLVRRLAWDGILHRQLEGVRLVFMPVVNPGGMASGNRANPAGVDLMRNAPVEAREPVPFLLGGQRLSRHLPWYRGAPERGMEAESRALCRVVESELLVRDFSIAVDCHSGFGLRDRIWFPYAHTTFPIEHLAEMHALERIFEQSHPHHPYLFEPQSRNYLTHGDLWDHLYLAARRRPQCIFLPLTLEMGSWLWVKKNPRQILSLQGLFNPLIEHRQQRVLRRHLPWLDFLVRAAASHERWLPAGATRTQHRRAALARWYERGAE